MEGRGRSIAVSPPTNPAMPARPASSFSVRLYLYIYLEKRKEKKTKEDEEEKDILHARPTRKEPSNARKIYTR